jgi:hypothetical protein
MWDCWILLSHFLLTPPAASVSLKHYFRTFMEQALNDLLNRLLNINA